MTKWSFIVKILNKSNLSEVETLELQVLDVLSPPSEPLKDFSEPLCNFLIRSFYLVHCFSTHFWVKGVIEEDSTHLAGEFHRPSEVYYIFVDSTSEIGCELFLLCHSLVGTVTATRVSDVGGARRQSCVTTFTRGRNLMVLGTWKRRNGRLSLHHHYGFQISSVSP